MKFLDKLALTIFSLIMIAISVINCLLVFGWLELVAANNFVANVLDNPTYCNISLVISALFILLGLKCLFFSSGDNDKVKSNGGIMLENESGKLVVSKETLINIINTVANGFESTENVTSRIYLDKDNNLKIFVELFVHSNVVIKDLTINLQKRIKETIKKTVDMEVKEIDVKIKNISAENNKNKEKLK